MKNKTPMPSVYDVAVGALLHDIGKLVQRGSDDDIPQVEISYAQWHSQWTEKFFNLIEEEKLSWPKCINLAWVRNLAVFYPKNGVSTSHSVTELVRVADSLASGDKVRSTHDMNEVTVQNWNEFKKKRLVALVPSLKLPENSFSRGGFHLPSSFDADSLMPSIGEEDKIGNQIFNMYKQVWTNFQKGWEEIVNAQSVSTCPGLFVEGLVSLMEKWFWAVPSSTVDEQSDISLFDHSRMVAAFSVALYHYHKVNNSLTSPSIVNDNKLSKFRLLIGDLSGIQTTLFRLSRESVSGLNRILRGRSLRFQFIADAAIRRLLEKFDLPWSSVLQTAGGRFLILVPDLGEEITNIRINQLRTEKEQWLVENYSGDLGFGIAITKPFSAQKIINETYEDCQVEIEKRARLIREEVIISSETAKLRLFQEPAKRAVLKFDYHDGICKVCGIRPAKSENQEDLCKTCMEEKKLGRCYPKANMVVIEKRDSNAEIFGLSYKLPLPNENTQKYQEKKGWQFRNGEQLGSAVFRPGYCYVPTFVEENSNNIKNLEGHGDIKTFEDLAKIPRGREILALFKADMDRLGELFNKGITPWSFAKTSTLSRMIDGYFSLRLPKLLENDYPNIYTVYAGGDDLMLLGSWYDIFNFAAKIKTDFSEFSLDNPSVNISAGIALFGVKSPVATAAREAEKRLNCAKDSGRNKISAIEKAPMKWTEYEKALKNANRIDNFLQEKILSTATIYRLLILMDSLTRIKDNEASPEDYAWRAKLGYTLGRNFPPEHKRSKRQNEAFELIIELFGLDKGLNGITDAGIGAILALTHALYRNRE